MTPILGLRSGGALDTVNNQGQRVAVDKTGKPLPLVSPKKDDKTGVAVETTKSDATPATTSAATAPAKEASAPAKDVAPAADSKPAPAKEAPAPASDGIGTTNGKLIELKTRGSVEPPKPEDNKPSVPVEHKPDEQQKGDVIYKAKKGDSLSSVVANNFEVVESDGSVRSFLLDKKGVVSDADMRKIALAGAETLVGTHENKPIADANVPYAKDKKHRQYSAKADFLGAEGVKGQEKTSQVVLRETYDVDLGEGRRVTLRRKNTPAPEAPKPQVQEKSAELTPEDAKIAREEIPDCRRRQFNGGNVNACYDGPSQENPKVGVYRPVVGGNVDRQHTLTTEQAVKREKSAHSEGAPTVLKPKQKVTDVVAKEYVDTKTGKKIDVTTDRGKATLLGLEEGIRKNDKNKTAKFTEGSSFFMPRTLDAYGQNYMLQSDWLAMQIPQGQNQHRWNLWDAIFGGNK